MVVGVGVVVGVSAAMAIGGPTAELRVLLFPPLPVDPHAPMQGVAHALAAASGAAPFLFGVLIGGGLLGLEAAAGLKARGMAVTVIHLMPHLMERQLDGSAGFLLERELTSRGINVICGANTKEIRGDGKVEAVLLEDGRVIPADMVIMAVGIRPNFGLAQSSGLKYNRGLLVNDEMKTDDPEVFAIGECIEHRGATYGLVAPLYALSLIHH